MSARPDSKLRALARQRLPITLAVSSPRTAVAPRGMRKGLDALAAMVRETVGDDPMSGHLLVVRSRRGGDAIWMK